MADSVRVDPQRTPEMKGIVRPASYRKSGNTSTRNFLHSLPNILKGTTGHEERYDRHDTCSV